MINPQITLISKIFTFDSIGNQVATETQVDVPIIRIETIYANEFYNASQNNMKPELKIVISSLNYNNENEFMYNNEHFSIIRTEFANLDEIKIVGERKIIKNVSQS